MILLDTHVWLWLRSQPDRLPAHAHSLVQSDDPVVSAISCWEIATLERLGRIELDRDVETWIGRAISEPPAIRIVEVSRDIAIGAGRLDDTFPGDPADRIIYTTALSLRCLLLTKDRRLRSFAPMQTVWEPPTSHPGSPRPSARR